MRFAELLDHPVDLFEEVETEASGGHLAGHEVGELVLEGLGGSCLPGEGDGVDRDC